ncbi:amino acid adenylation domain-containing protein [Pendulispora rubella]|uniref:Amino acid adenylation domain-containing protein n=1 Tax=Pendulispora rubella TaxID=2741070 RepID=A0ABZ2LGQ1_9BACT
MTTEPATDVRIADVYDLSPMQQGMLFQYLYASKTTMYRERLHCQLRGPLDVNLFRKAGQWLVTRHAALRTCFSWERRDKLLQIVLENAELPWEYNDLRALSPEARQLCLGQIVDLIDEEQFDLAQAPLFRITVVRTEDELHHLVVSYHHIIMDGWSAGVAISELFSAYDALVQKRPLEVSPVRPFRDYIIWLRQQETSAAEAYWRKKLEGFVAPTPIGFDRAVAATSGAGSRGGSHQHREIFLSAETTAGMDAFARTHRITQNTLLQGAWAWLLGAYSGEQDIVFGAVTSGRPSDLTGVESMVGLFVNSLPNRIQVDPDAQLVPWLQEILKSQVEARQFGYVSLVQAQEWSQVRRPFPLFESLQGLQNLPLTAADFAKISESLGIGGVDYTNHVGVPLILIAMPGEQLSIRAIYDASRFQASDIDRILAHHVTLLENMIAHPGARLAELTCMSDEERALILGPWRMSDRPGAPDSCIHELVEAQVLRTPKAIAATFEDQRLTYAELNQRANQLAHYLRARGVGPEIIVGICVERSLEALVAMLAVLKAGGAYACFDANDPRERLAFMLEDTAPAVVLTLERLLDRLPSHEKDTVVLDRDWAKIAKHDTSNPSGGATPRNLAYIVYTSGSTGRPKGALMEHRGVRNVLDDHRGLFGVGLGTRMLQFARFTFDASVWEIYLSLTSGGTVCFARDEAMMPGRRLGDLIRKEKIELTLLAPSVMAVMSEESIPTFRVVAAGSEAVPPALVAQWGERCKVIHVYGPTETTIICVSFECDGWDGERRLPLGRPTPGVQVYILDSQLRPVPSGVPGELCIGGPGVSRGYLHRPELTASKFVQSPFSNDPDDRLYRSGDLVRWGSDGLIEYIGRTDSQIKLRGFRVELGEIETVLSEHPAVEQSVVIPREGFDGEKQLVAYVTRKKTGSAGAERASSAWHGEQVAQWSDLFDRAYHDGAPSPSDAAFNIAGWNSSFTGAPIPANEMREWVDATVASITRTKPRSVLEIGCGTGLLLFRLAPQTTRYVGLDFSKVALDYVGQHLAAHAQDGLAHVELLQRKADDLSGIESGFESVVINSVVQYFPSAEYLRSVVTRAVSATCDGGCVFVGDVRSFPLIEAFHAAVQLFRADPGLTTERLAALIRTEIDKDEELLVDPAFFHALAHELPRIRGVEVHHKRGLGQNEMTLFRYDVVLHVGPRRGAEAAVEGAPHLDWTREGLSVAALRERLERHDQDVLVVDGIPNARLVGAVHLAELVKRGDAPATVAALRETLKAAVEGAVDPETLCLTVADLPYDVDIAWAGHGAEGRFNATFRRRGTTKWLPTPKLQGFDGNWDQYTNDPLKRRASAQLVSELRERMQRKLPEHMVPASIVVLDAFPKTTTNKVDRRALPAPGDEDGRERTRYVAPRTTEEVQIQQIWQEVLQLRSVGVHDDFFDLGGHSLLAVRLMATIKRQLGVDLSLSTLFRGFTIEKMADLAAAARAGIASSPIVRMTGVRTDKAPFFCAPPGGGNLVCYVDLARRLGASRTVYGLESPGLVGEGNGFDTIEKLATHCIEAMKTVQPKGPYHLGGWSFGGLVVYEMAKQLEEMGDPVAFLGLFDTSLPTRAKQVDDSNDLHARRMVRTAKSVEMLFGLSIHLRYEELVSLNPSAQLEVFLARTRQSDPSPDGLLTAKIVQYLRLLESNLAVYRTYRPAPLLPGGDLSMTFFRAKDPLPETMVELEHTAHDAAEGWMELAPGRVRLIDVPGDHLNMFRPPHVDVLAASLNRCFEGIP